MNFKTLTLAGTVGLAAALFAGPVLAHHSFAMFDHDILLEYEATVVELEWINPHSWLHVRIVGENGEETQWSFEGGSVAQLVRAGWTRDAVAAGDNVTVGFHPINDGSHGGQLLTVLLANGRMMRQGGGAVSDPPVD